MKVQTRVLIFERKLFSYLLIACKSLSDPHQKLKLMFNDINCMKNQKKDAILYPGHTDFTIAWITGTQQLRS